VLQYYVILKLQCTQKLDKLLPTDYMYNCTYLDFLSALFQSTALKIA
jgi:hypothetical protein